MAFDLASATPVKAGFDLASAVPVNSSASQDSMTPGTASTVMRMLGGSPLGGDLAKAEAGLSIGSSMIAAPVAGLVGIGQGIKNLVSPGMTAGNRVEQVANALTYKPRTEGGAAITEGLNYPLQKVAQLGDFAGRNTAETTGSPAAGAAINTAIQALPSLLLRGRAKPAEVAGDVSRSNPLAGPAAAATETSQALPARSGGAPGLETVSDTPAQSPVVRTALDAGYKLKPSEVGATGGSIAEGLSGSAKLETALIVKNQKVTNRLALQEIGLPENARITPNSFKYAKAPYNKVYAEVGKKLGEVPTDETYAADIQAIGRNPGTSFKKATNADVESLKDSYIEDRFNAQDAVLETRKLRAAARKNIKAPNDPAKNELGYAQLKVSDAIESQMERQGQALGENDLIARFRKAREALAKINTVERAVRNGNIDARLIAKQGENMRISGRLGTIAEVANEFPNVTRNAAKVKQQSPVNMTETAFGLAGALAHPLLATGMVARPLTRAALMSDRYQGGLSKPLTPLAPPDPSLVPLPPQGVLAP